MIAHALIVPSFDAADKEQYEEQILRHPRLQAMAWACRTFNLPPTSEAIGALTADQCAWLQMVGVGK